MNDDYGYPMSLRPNKKQEAAMGAAAGGIPGDAAGEPEWPDDDDDVRCTCYLHPVVEVAGWNCIV